ncbi:hypothetical protein XELAEV_18045542mg [Xenopus laevis]|uniref:Uncharacterized protein n=1 Tax=Xenopus laevis TaxID=8355 RepID=A0A974H4C6_XENLA|nr:hypothetical protein XELAEV_18045542mg [Xenopus laevis]
MIWRRAKPKATGVKGKGLVLPLSPIPPACSCAGLKLESSRNIGCVLGVHSTPRLCPRHVPLLSTPSSSPCLEHVATKEQLLFTSFR